MPAPPIRCACIDVGSNTTALLVADVSERLLAPVGTRRHFTMLGEGLGADGISAEKIAEVADAASDLFALAEKLGADRVELIATQAVRVAANREELAAALESAVGKPLEVIPGEAEARYSFIGAIGGMHRLSRPTVVIDAGGGSTEVSWCSRGSELVTRSFAIGSAQLQREHFHSDPPSAAELAAAHDHAEGVFAALDLPADAELALAVGGGATTAQRLSGGLIDPASVKRIQQLVQRESSSALAERYDLQPNRARLLPAGLAILGTLSERIGVPLEVGLGGLREGVLLDRHAAPERD